ncbi:MAG: hypothetical protein AAGF99_03095 [Bacteroidota bacterium]
MGRFLLLIVVGATVLTTATMYRNQDIRIASKQQQVESYDKALAREAADAGHTAVLTAMLSGGRVNPELPLDSTRAFTIDGREVRIEHYQIDGDIISFSVVGMHGGVEHRITSSYRLDAADLPGPLWVDAPVVSAVADSRAEIRGIDREGARRPIYLDGDKVGEYSLNGFLSVSQMRQALGATMAQVSLGNPAHGGVQALLGSDVGRVLDQHNTPPLEELYGRALASIGPDDITYAGTLVVNSALSFGNWNNLLNPDPRIVRVRGDLVIPSGQSITGSGVLLIEGNLTVQGALRWDGLVYMQSFEQELGADLSTGLVEIRGTLIAEQEAPPPGGHMDMTVYRDMTGDWNAPSGESRPNNWLRHTHRIDGPIADQRFVFFGEGNPHEGYTRFGETLSRLSSTDEVYLRFRNTENHGFAFFEVQLDDYEHANGSTSDDIIFEGTVRGGFGALAESAENEYRTKAFAVQDLDRFVVDIQSRRMLRHLFDDIPNTHPEVNCAWDGWPWRQGCIPLDSPRTTSWLHARGGALQVQLYEADDDELVYDAVMYWHRRGAWDTRERDAEIRADSLWRESIRNGTADYGTRLNFGPNVQLSFSQAHLYPALNRLGLSSDAITHLASSADHYVEGGDVDQDRNRSHKGKQKICFDGNTILVSIRSVQDYLAQGAYVGACGVDTRGNYGEEGGQSGPG